MGQNLSDPNVPASAVLIVRQPDGKGWILLDRPPGAASLPQTATVLDDSDRSRVLPSLQEALSAASTLGDRIRIVEGPLAELGQQLLQDRNAIQVVYHPCQAELSLVRRFARSGLELFQSWLTGTGKSSLNCGSVTLDPEQARQILASRLPFGTLGQMVAVALALEIPVVETRCSDRRPALDSASAGTLVVGIASTVRNWWQVRLFPRPSAVDADPIGSLKSASRITFARALAGLLLIVLTGWLLLGHLDYPLFEPDETRNAQLALNMLESGDWMSLTLDGQPYWDKPPLQAWLTAASLSVSGVNERAIRLPGALMGMATIAIVLVLGNRIVGFRAAWFGAAMVLISGGFGLMSRFVTMDMALTLCTTLTGLAILSGLQRGTGGWGWWILAGVGAGLGLLAKGPVVVVLTVPPLLLHCWLDGASIRPWLVRGLAMIFPATLIAGPWFLATAYTQPGFLECFFWRHNLVRFTEAFNHQQPVWFYLPVMLLALYPASFVLTGLFGLAAAGPKARRELLAGAESALLVWSGWIVLFFSLSESKLPTYILPAIPPLGLLLGRIIDLSMAGPSLVPNRLGLGFAARHMALSSAILLTGITIWQFLPVSIPSGGISVGAASLALLAIVAAAGLAIRGTRIPALPAWTTAVVVAIVFHAAALGSLVPAIARYRSLSGSVAELVRQTPSEDTVLFFGERPHAVSLLMPEQAVHWIPLEEPDLAGDFLEQHPDTILVTHPHNLTAIRENSEANLEFAVMEGERKIFRARAEYSSLRTANAVPDAAPIH